MPKTLEPQPFARRRSRLGRVQRVALAEMIEGARKAKGWTQERLAMVATNRLKSAPDDLALAGLRAVLVTRRFVQCLENCHPQPMGNAERRARLLGVCLALDLDRAEVNLIAGGI